MQEILSIINIGNNLQSSQVSMIRIKSLITRLGRIKNRCLKRNLKILFQKIRANYNPTTSKVWCNCVSENGKGLQSS